jgi:glycosyltransferase involved in cell wall biosynthesis
MADHPLVSIITPSYNQASYLEQTLVSVLQQDYPNIEYLVVDGDSTDGSQAIIKKYADQLTWWISEPDSGQAVAINKGIKRSKGKYLAWLNSDDYYLPETVKKAVSIFQKHPQISLLYGDVLAVNAQGKQINLLRYEQYSLQDLMCFKIIGQPSVFLRRSFLKKAGYLDPSFHFLLDHQLWLRMAILAPICYLPETLSAARFHSESKNINQASLFGEDAYRIVDWMRSTPELQYYYKKLNRKVMAGAQRIDARYRLDGGQASEAFKVYLKCLGNDPGTALKEWYRIIFALFSMLGFGNLFKFHPRWKKQP